MLARREALLFNSVHGNPGDFESPSAERREKKSVVVAIRGTQSIADLVTDAVVHPEPMESWVPQVDPPCTPCTQCTLLCPAKHPSYGAPTQHLSVCCIHLCF